MYTFSRLTFVLYWVYQGKSTINPGREEYDKNRKAPAGSDSGSFPGRVLPSAQGRLCRQSVEPAFSMPGPSPAAAQEGDVLYVMLRTSIDINHADARELTALPGVGPVLAESIVAYRTEHGPFGSVEELLLVNGFGPGTLEALYAAADGP